MALTLEQLRATVTKDEALAVLLSELNTLGFPTTSWQSGSLPLTLLELFADRERRLSEVVSALAELAFNSLSTGNALTLFSSSHYDNARAPAVRTRGTVKLTAVPTAGPYVIAVGQLVVADVTDGFTYRNLTGGTIPLGGTLDLTFEAEVAGAARNVPNNSITVFLTPLAGVTVSNPPVPPSSTWITQNGVDEESDAALRIRNLTKWATLSIASPKDAYVNIARQASAAIARVEIDDQNPQGPGSTDVYIAGATGVSGVAEVAAAQALLDQKRPVTNLVRVLAAVAQVQDFTATIHVVAALNTPTKQTEIQQALRDYINGLPISGTFLPAAPNGVAVFSEMVGALTAVVGVERVSLTTPAADVAIAMHRVMTVGVLAFTFVSV